MEVEEDLRAAIRAEMKARRRAVSPELRAAKSHELCEKLLKIVGSAKLICCYQALKTELDLSEFIERIGGVEIVFPERRGEEYVVPRAEEVDLWICPGLAFTTEGARLGFGGGWYDRFLAQVKPTARKLGVAYDFQLLPSLPQGPWDIPLDAIVVV